MTSSFLRRAPSLRWALWLAVGMPGWIGAQPASAATGGGNVQEEPAEIVGLVVARKGEGFLGLSVEGASLRVTFYDKDRKKAPADVLRVVARWHDGKPRRAVLRADTADSFVSPPVLSPPFKFIGAVVLVQSEEEDAESYPVNFNLLVRPPEVSAPAVAGGAW